MAEFEGLKAMVALDVAEIKEESEQYGFTREMIGQYAVVLRVWPLQDEYLATDMARLIGRLYSAQFAIRGGSLELPDPDLKEKK